MNRCLQLVKLTFLSLWVRLDFQHHGGHSISIHVIQRVCDPLKQDGSNLFVFLKTLFVLQAHIFGLSFEPPLSTAYMLYRSHRTGYKSCDLTAHLQQHHAGCMDHGDVFEDLQSVLLHSIQLFYII